MSAIFLLISSLSVILDNNSTHKHKMQAQLQAHLSSLQMKDKIVWSLFIPLAIHPTLIGQST